MTTFDRVKLLAKQKGLSMKQLALTLGFGENAFYKWKTSSPSTENLQKVADYFDVSTDYLLGRTDKKKYYDLTETDRNDIAVEAERILEGLDSDAEVNYYGEPLDSEDKEKLKDALELALSLTRVKAKKKFTPKKYRD